MKESKFQAELIKELKKIFPGCVVLKNDAEYLQGIPDITILYKDKWAMLECKKGANEKHRPLQDDYVERLNEMSYSSFVFPENKREVMEDLQRLFDI